MDASLSDSLASSSMTSSSIQETLKHATNTRDSIRSSKAAIRLLRAETRLAMKEARQLRSDMQGMMNRTRVLFDAPEHREASPPQRALVPTNADDDADANQHWISGRQESGSISDISCDNTILALEEASI